VRYFETLRHTLKTYLEYKQNNLDFNKLINSVDFVELYIVQYRFIQDSFRSIVKSLKDSIN